MPVVVDVSTIRPAGSEIVPAARRDGVRVAAGISAAIPQPAGKCARTLASAARWPYRKLGADYQYYEQPPPRRPKGMHRSTYERLTAELYDAMEMHNEIFEIGAVPILARLMKSDARLRKR